jgi:hypothetical protein
LHIRHETPENGGGDRILLINPPQPGDLLDQLKQVALAHLQPYWELRNAQALDAKDIKVFIVVLGNDGEDVLQEVVSDQDIVTAQAGGRAPTKKFLVLEYFTSVRETLLRTVLFSQASRRTISREHATNPWTSFSLLHCASFTFSEVKSPWLVVNSKKTWQAQFFQCAGCVAQELGF